MLQAKNYKQNFRVFLWHAVFLALASNFMDVDTVIPSMLLKFGGSSVHLGLLTTIMIGGASFMQLVFSLSLASKEFKKKYLIIGINLRIASLFALAFLFLKSDSVSHSFALILIFVLISIFSFSGSFANISYVDIVGKVIDKSKRKQFFSLKQLFTSVGFIISAFTVKKLINHYEFPVNYSVVFLIAAVLLLIASFGFYRIVEVEKSGKGETKLLRFLKNIPVEFKKSKNLRNYIFTLNTLGIGISLIPFMILLAKENMDLSFSLIGNIIVLRTLGMLISSLIFYFVSKKISYRNILYMAMILGSLLPFFSIVFIDNTILFQSMFFFAGFFVSSFKIAKGGIIVEISNNENRTFYAGLSGAGGILSILFPILAGYLVQIININFVFVLMGILMLLSIFFIKNLNCKIYED